MLGLPFGFASHFSPALLLDALALYRKNFKPSAFLKEPYALACVNVIAADSDDEAQYLATSFYQLALGMFRNMRRPLQPPVSSMDNVWTDVEKEGVLQMMKYSFIGSKNTVRKSLQSFLEKTDVDEIMITCNTFDFNARLKSLSLTADLFLTRE
jgi:luciferase family oxidoreductase group 1